METHYVEYVTALRSPLGVALDPREALNVFRGTNQRPLPLSVFCLPDHGAS